MIFYLNQMFCLHLAMQKHLTCKAKTIRVAATRNQESKQREELQKEVSFWGRIPQGTWWISGGFFSDSKDGTSHVWFSR